METIGETGGNVWGNGENMQGNATRGISEPLGQQFSNRFIHSQIHLRMTAEYAWWANQYIAVHFFHGFLPHMISYAKFIFVAISGNGRSAIFVLSFYGGSVAHT